MLKNLMNSKYNKNRFTLVELLVVIAIIGILSSMLLPSLKNAREASYSAVCKSNLRQIGIESQLHLDANDDEYTFHYSRWDSAMEIEDSGLLKCPADTREDRPAGPADSINGGAYGVNNRDLWTGSGDYSKWWSDSTLKMTSVALDPTKFIVYQDSEWIVVDYAWTSTCGAYGMHKQQTHNSVLADGHVELQNYILTDNGAGNLTLDASDLGFSP